MADKTDEIENVPSNETEAKTNSNKFEPEQYVTFDLSDMKARVKMFNAHNNAISFNSLGDKPINIVDVMTEIGERTQSHNKCQNTYLFTDDNQVYFSQSNGIGKTVNELVAMVDSDFKANTENGYVTVAMKSTALSGDRSYKTLQLISI